jgi:hypothetical protein
VTPDCERARRAAAVRAAGRSWHRAGAIDEATLKAVEAAVPDDRVRVGPVFRVLLFVFTIIAVTSGLAFVVMVLQIENSGHGGLLAAFGFVAGASLAFATDYQIVRMRRSQGGTEGATSLLAIGYLIGAAAWCILEFFGSRSREELVVGCLVAAALAGVAAWRWGYSLYAGLATAALLVALAGLPCGRLLWIFLPLMVGPFLLRLSESLRLPPSHRASWTAVLAVAIVGLYFAVHIGSWEWQLLEEIGGGARMMRPAQRDALWWLSAAATALVPVVLLGLGIRRRRYPLLILGAGTAVASLVTLRWYVHLAPLWVVITASGAALVGLVLGLRRWLDAGPGKERGGFTAEPLFQDLARQRVLEMGAAVVSLSPEARNLHEEPKFEGHGGQFGGGGSSEEF